MRYVMGIRLPLVLLFMIALVCPAGAVDVLVGSSGTASVGRYNSVSGAFLGTFISSGTGGLSAPRGMVIGGDRNLYIADFNTNSILRFNGDTGAFVDVFVPAGLGGLKKPVGLAFSGDGRLFVASSASNQILTYDTQGAFLGVFASGSGLLNPSDLIFGADGNLYVCSQNANTVLKYTLGTGSVSVFVTARSGGLSLPAGLRFGPDGNLYVSSLGTSTVLRYDGATGAFLGTFASGNGLNLPFGLTFGLDNNLYVVNNGDDSVLRFDATTGAFVGIFIGAGGGGLNGARYLAFGLPPLASPPIANAGIDQSVNEGDLVTLDGSASTSSGGALAYHWTQISGTSVSLSDVAAIQPTFTAPSVSAIDTLVFQLVVTADGLSSPAALVNVSVKNVNVSPVANAGTTQTVMSGATVTLDASQSYDADNDALNFTWMQTGGPDVVLSDIHAMQPTFVAPQVGRAGDRLAFSVMVDDGVANSTASVQIVVERINHAPIAVAGSDQTVQPGMVVTLNGSESSDPDGDALVYAWVQSSGPKVNLDQVDTIHPRFTAPAISTPSAELTFALVVNDGLLSSAPSTVTITVVTSREPPRCDLAQASTPILWPPNHKFREESVVGVIDPRSSTITVRITSVESNARRGKRHYRRDRDYIITGPNKVLLRASRDRHQTRTYEIHFTATNASGDSCTAYVPVYVKHPTKHPKKHECRARNVVRLNRRR